MSDAKDEQGKQAATGEPAPTAGPVDSAKGETSPPTTTESDGPSDGDSPAGETAPSSSDEGRRRVRRSRKVEGVDVPAAEAEEGRPPRRRSRRGEGGEGSAAEGEEGRPPRRRRRARTGRRSAAKPGDRPAKPSDGPAKPSDGPAKPSDGSPRPRRTAGRPPGRPRRSGPADKTPARRVYRQDIPGGQPAPPAPTAESREQEKRDKIAAEKATPAKINEQDQITLILHPAPKAAPARRKKKDSRPKTAKETLKAKAVKRGQTAKTETQSDEQTGPVELQEQWLTADIDSAAPIIAEAAAAGEALINAWLDGSNTAAIARVATMDDVSGKVRKAARRALQVLKSRGVEIPKIELPSDQAEEQQPEPCVASFVPADASGVCFLSVSQRQPGGRYQVADVMMSEPLGITYASTGRIAGKQIRKWRNRVVERFGVPPVDVSLEWARHKIAEARKRNDESKQLIPLGFDSCAPLLSPAPDEPPPHPVAELEENVSEADVSKAVGDSDKLHADPEFRSWMPERQALDELLAKLGERIGADGGEDPKVVDEALRAEVAAATDRWFQPELRTMFADRMRDSAISVRHRAGDDAARRVLAVARAIREAGIVTSPPNEIPFLSALFEKAIALMARQGNGQLRVPVPQNSAETE